MFSGQWKLLASRQISEKISENRVFILKFFSETNNILSHSFKKKLPDFFEENHGLIYSGLTSAFSINNEPEFIIHVYNGRYEDGKKILIQIPLNSSEEKFLNSRYFL